MAKETKWIPLLILVGIVKYTQASLTMQCIHPDESKCPQGSTHVDMEEIYQERVQWEDDEEENEEEDGEDERGYGYPPPRGGGGYYNPQMDDEEYMNPYERGGAHMDPDGRERPPMSIHGRGGPQMDYGRRGPQMDYGRGGPQMDPYGRGGPHMDPYGRGRPHMDPYARGRPHMDPYGRGGPHMDPYGRSMMEEDFEDEDYDEDREKSFSPYTSFHNDPNPESSTEPNSPYEKTTNVNDLWQNFKCDAVFSKQRTIPTEATWMLLRGIYQGTVGIDSSTIDYQYATGIQISSTEVKQTPDDKGRGLYAADYIPKGTLIWKPKQTACFTDGNLYRSFLKNIPSDLACDVLQWAYVMDKSVGFYNDPSVTKDTSSSTSSKKEYAICVDLDEGILMNSGEYVHSEIPDFDNILDRSEIVNVGCDLEAAVQHEGGCAQNLFALYDIHADEELLVDYESFADVEGWDIFGL